MTEKDYELIAACFADTLREARHDAAVGHARAYLGELANSLASEFAEQNSRFDRTRFLKACGLED